MPSFAAFRTADVAAFVAAAAAIASACATLFAASVSRHAAEAWRDNLRQERLDALVAAAASCAGSIGRCVSLRLGATGPVPAIDEAWASWRAYRTAHAVARTYLPSLPDTILRDGTGVLEELTRFNREHIRRDFLEGAAINDRFGLIIQAVEGAVTPIAKRRTLTPASGQYPSRTVA